MSKKIELGVQQAEHRRHASSAPLDWETARVFLEVARRKSLRAAAIALGRSVNVLRARIAELESGLNVKLMTRHVDGVRLTAEGQRVFAAAHQMEIASFAVLRAASGETESSGRVRLAVTEGLATFWVAPRLAGFTRAHSKILIDLRCSMSPADVLRLEADVAVQISPPEAKDVRRVKLGRLHAIPFGSKAYLQAHGTPQTLADLKNHQLLLQESDQVQQQREFHKLFGDASPFGFVAIKSNMSSVHYAAVLSGAGLGVLPSYAALLDRALVPLNLGYSIQQDIYMVYHADIGRVARVRSLIDWLIEIFSPKKCPWFADEFVPPSEFGRAATKTR